MLDSIEIIVIFGPSHVFSGCFNTKMAVMTRAREVIIAHITVKFNKKKIVFPTSHNL